MGLRVEMLALRTKERKEEKWLHRAGTLPSFWCAEGLQAKICPRGRSGETRDEEGALHLVHGISQGYRRVENLDFYLDTQVGRCLTNNAFFGILESTCTIDSTGIIQYLL